MTEPAVNVARPLPAALSGLRVPVLGAPMFIVSTPELVIAQCAAGILGSFPSLNARGEGELDDWLSQIAESLGSDSGRQPAYAINLIAHRSNSRQEADLATSAQHRVPIVICSLGSPRDVVEVVHAYGGLVLQDVTTDALAHKAIDSGADGLIAVAAGAGGHTGSRSPFALTDEIRRWFFGPLVLSGAISTGRSILGARALGADLAGVGSAFLPALEARTSDAYRQMVVDGTSASLVTTAAITGIDANFLRGSLDLHGIDLEQLASRAMTGIDFGAAVSGVRAWRDVWGAGQGIGAVTAIEPAAQIVDRLSREYGEAVDDLLVTLLAGSQSERKLLGRTPVVRRNAR